MSFMTEARRGGLRRRAKGSTERLILSRVQSGLVERLTEESPADAPAERRLVIGAIEMGLGKTLAALAALCVLRGRAVNGRARALFVVPKSTILDTWRRQRRAFTTITGRSLVVVTYARLQRAYVSGWSRSSPAGAGRRSSTWVRGAGDALLETTRDLVVFDESHVLRNPNTLLGRAAAVLSDHSIRVLCLTGTPVHNGPADASGQLRAMGSGSALEDPLAFGSRATLHADAVKSFASNYVYNATLADAGITLPGKTSKIHWVGHELDAHEVLAYNTSLRAVNGVVDYMDNGVEEGEEAAVTGAVRHHNLLIMRQLCVEPALFHKHGRGEFDDIARALTVASPGPKLRAAFELVRHLVFEGHDKIVIVSEFVALLDCFRDLAAAKLGEKVLSFDGRLSAQARSRVVDEFLNGESRLLCLSLGAGAYGLNLVPGPSAMIILDVWFNPAVHRQVEARIRRIGQTKPVVIHTLVTRGSIEESILATHDEKERCASAMISGDINSITTDVHPSDHRIARTCEPLKAHASAM
jgi:hypothetical protein